MTPSDGVKTTVVGCTECFRTLDRAEFLNSHIEKVVFMVNGNSLCLRHAQDAVRES